MKYATVQTMIRRLHNIMTLEKISECLDVDVKTIYRWENGKNQPSFINFLKIVSLCEKKGIQMD